ncbi:MAG: entericidin A/B family lipoprotein [Pseudomonadota bacterium]|jgi:entericidin A
MKKLFTLSLLALILTGCNTINGFGKDVKKVGEAVEGASSKK